MVKTFWHKFMFIIEKIQKFQTWIEHILKEFMIADLLTKKLTVKVFVEHVNHMGVIKSFNLLV